MYKGVFVSYRRGKRTQRNKQILIRIEGVNSRSEAARFIGRKSAWESKTGKRILGKVVGIHGRRGLVRVSLKKGLPGQALGSQITIK